MVMAELRLAAAGVALAALAAAFWQVNDRAWARGYATAQAVFDAERLAAAREAQDFLSRAAARQQSAAQEQLAADAAFERQQADIHAQEGGDAPVSPYLAGVVRRLWP